jgi:hypothetical protein
LTHGRGDTSTQLVAVQLPAHPPHAAESVKGTATGGVEGRGTLKLMLMGCVLCAVREGGVMCGVLWCAVCAILCAV